MPPGIRSRVVCPDCRRHLDADLRCEDCGREYPRLSSIALLLPEPARHVELWRKQLGLIAQQGSATKQALEAQVAETGTSRSARARLRALAQAVEDQVDDITAILAPVLGGALPPGDVPGLPRGFVEYIGYLYRDWGWADGQCEENQRSLDAIKHILASQALGRTLVLGAGACRLAYDLHRQCGATETAVLDIDPYLLVIAEAVVRGSAVKLTESTANVHESAVVSRRWTLSAPSDPLGEDVFHFFLANGIEPPFEDQTFDAVVTPWFIDQVPTDLQAFLSTVHRLLVPGGIWVNQGPLIYRPDTIPISRWYPREELQDLAGAAGFRIGQWESASHPYLVSPLTGRGRIERVVTFLASRM
jgi:SAM-dependent methyltransferase